MQFFANTATMGRRPAQEHTVTAKRSSKTARRAFDSEAEMVNRFVAALSKRSSRFGKLAIATEWDHRAGYVDVLARDRNRALIAFEAKLGDWKRAFMQAYRNTAYADRAYVLLPAGVADRAFAHKGTFEDKGIGLCRFDGEQIEILVEAANQVPLVAWVRSKAHEHFDGLGHEPRKGASRSSGRDLQAAHA